MSQVRLELANQDEAYNTPDVRAWLLEVEGIINEKAKKMEMDLLVYGAVYVTQENMTATEVALRKAIL